ncbi:MAG: transglycosylase SLT domain-containing protein [Xanthomonadales bacterium]|nr:transglycosylase SLT domain-containing protein [Xanthomonadales bacterium]
MPPRRRPGGRLPALLVAALLAACASTPPPAPPRPDEAAINRLYGLIEPAVARYEAGLARLREGDGEGGRAEMEAAVEELRRAGSACAETLGCEPQRFFAAYGNLLTLRAEVLIGEQEGFVEVEPAVSAESPIVAHLPEAGRTIQLLDGRSLAEIIELNGPVKAALFDWLTWMRPLLLEAWENYQHMRHLMWPAYEEAGLPEALLFGILAKESGGRVHAVSRAGAAGPLQFMPHTGRRFGLGVEQGFDLRFDPAAAARANVAYLNEQFALLNRNLELALAAYNGGEGRVQRLVRQARDKRFWSPEIFHRLPRETREYVPYVLAAAWLFMHPERYGLEFAPAAGGEERVRLERPASLSELAICLGQEGSRNGWFRVLRNLNPRHDPHRRLPAGTELALPRTLLGAYRDRCVEGELGALAAELYAARRPGAGGEAMTVGASYVVQRGDTLASIARRHGCRDPLALARANGIAPPRYLIRPGQRLSLSGCRS